MLFGSDVHMFHNQNSVFHSVKRILLLLLVDMFINIQCSLESIYPCFAVCVSIMCMSCLCLYISTDMSCIEIALPLFFLVDFVYDLLINTWCSRPLTMPQCLLQLRLLSPTYLLSASTCRYIALHCRLYAFLYIKS